MQNTTDYNSIIEKAIEEIESKNFGTTEQLLTIHEVVYENNRPKVLIVDFEKSDGTVIVYFGIKNEKFHLALWLDTLPEISIRAVGTEPFSRVYLEARSESLSYQEISTLINIQPSSGWSKGDVKSYGNSCYEFSAVRFELEQEPDEFEDKLEKLLDLLETDKGGIAALVKESTAFIRTILVFHNGNTMLGGFCLTKKTVKRLAALDIEIDFDLYAEGNLYDE